MSEKVTFDLEKDSIVIADFTQKESGGFTLHVNGINGGDVLSLIGHLAHMLEQRDGFTVEDTAKHLVERQADIEQITGE